jgi:hypothetical protein
MGVMTAGHVEERSQARRDYHLAWWSLLLFLVSGAAAFAVGEGLANAYGYDGVQDDRAPNWLVLAAGYPALLVFAIPALVTTHLAGKARRAGVSAAVVPMIVAWGIAVVFALQGALAYLFG